MPTSVSLDVNGRAVTVMVDDPGMPLLYALRDHLELKGRRFGCGLDDRFHETCIMEPMG
jgi:nicotinate dehydrogenase subunit A